jgi:ubiquinone/menaquinone biosynthesis C-methylase UbiE
MSAAAQGFFTLAMAGLVGNQTVIAADLQEGMLQKLGNKIRGTELDKRISLHKCEADRLGLEEKLDFALAFYMVHEVPEKICLFKEIFELLKPGARFLMVEPKLFHVSEMEFRNTVNNAITVGFAAYDGPGMPFSWSVILRKA